MATKAALISEITTNFPDNTTGVITPAVLRTTTIDEINSWQQAPGINAQTGTTYTVASTDFGQLVTFNNLSPVSVSLPSATATGFTLFNVVLKNIGVGLVTVAPVTGTIDGAVSVTLATGQSMMVISDGANYVTAFRVSAGGGSVNGPGTSTVGHIATWNNIAGTLLADTTPAALTAALSLFSSSIQGVVPASGGGTTNFLRADGTWAAPAGGGGLTVGTTTIAGGASGNFEYNNAGILGERTPTQATAALNLFTTALQGLVPASGGGTTNFLRADGTWAAAGGGGGTPGGSNTQVQYNNSSAFGGANVYVENADTLALRNGVTAQSFYAYNTFTNSSNYERATFDWTTTANVLTIGLQAAGTGTLRAINYVAHGYSFYVDGLLMATIGSSGIVLTQTGQATGSVIFASVDTLYHANGRTIGVDVNGGNGGCNFRHLPDTPTTLSANQNNYNPGAFSKYQRLSASTAVSITGLTFSGTQVDGQQHYIINVGAANNITLANLSASSSAANQFQNTTGADIVLSPKQMAMLIYDNTAGKWLVSKLP